MSRKMKLDFTGVESFLRASEGEHVCRVAAADVKQSQGGNDMIVVQFEVTKGDDKGARVFENYPLIDTALWKLKGLLQAIGMKADGKVQLDLDKLVGKLCIVSVKHEEYEGKTRAKVDYVNKYSAASEDDDEDDVEEEDEAEEEQEEKPAKKPEKSGKKAPMNKPEPEEDDDDGDWEDEEDEEEEEKPAPKKSKKPAKEEKKPEKKSKKSKDEDEDDDWDDDDWDE